MKKGLFGFLAVLIFSITAWAGFGAYQSTTSLGIFNYIKCSTGLTCTRVGDKLQIVAGGSGNIAGNGSSTIYGYLQNRVAATATTLTAAQCGSTFYNSNAVEVELPDASTVLGCRYTFITANAANFDIDPDAADQILVQTNAAGDSIRNATLGNTITLEAISATQWTPVGILGTWSDNN